MKETTTSYRWPEGGVIRRIDVRQQKNGFAVAYLYADDREEQRAARTNIRAAIRLKGWGTLSDSRDGEFVLRVAGIRSGEELITSLREQGFITNEPVTAAQDEGKEKSKGLIDSVKSRTLRWSGILASFGNALAMIKGFIQLAKETDPKKRGKQFGQLGMGASFAVADLPLAFVDEHDNSRQLNLLLKQLTKEYERNGIEIPKNASIYIETSDKNKTFGERFKDFLHQYANQIKCGFEVIAAPFAIKAGLDLRAKQPVGKKTIPWKSVAGIIFGPAFLASLLIPEKKIDEEKYAKAGKLERLWMKIQSNPLSIGGLLGYSNTFATYASAWGEHKTQLALPKGDRNHLYTFDYAIPTVMIGANGLYAASKKTVGGSIDSDAMVQDAYRIASQIINKQPPELREQAIESTARFFNDRMEIKEHYADAKARLIKELGSQRENPWFESQGLAPYTPKPRKHVHGEVVQAENDNIATANDVTVPPPAALEAAPANKVSGVQLEARHAQAAQRQS